MNRGFGLILAAPIFFIALCTLSMITMVQTESRELEEYVMSFAIDYSTDAAVAEMLNVSHLGQDYIENWTTAS